MNPIELKFLRVRTEKHPTTGTTLEYLHHHHAVAVLILDTNEEKTLLVNQYRPGNRGNLYEVPAGLIDEDENPEEAMFREVLEETGIIVEFESIISLGHFYPHQFHKSNLYVICTANPKTFEINIQDIEEILDAKWENINTYLSDDSVLDYSKAIIIAALEEKGFERINQEVLAHIKKDFELFFPIKK